ncbi:MAG: bifunctional 4-hydroxy-2-oxoglutarate aldolase/2-dehydro-3-deoxy-phosphogluconate aldolase, partial [Clostridia bacterium]|nr:bifunctional 4-hydroxy-2-oxoglutarate aldolase/2-dehydro-3-deoxy-phosphogluconate aldolase [Clostridia bacterium]
MLPDFHTTLTQTRLIAILRGIPGELLPDVLDRLYDGGVRLAEITFDAAGILPMEETAAQIAMAARRMDGKMHIGAGTVLTAEQTELTKNAGGTFIISPHTDPRLIAETKKQGLFSLPGAMTVSEIVTAHRAGADYIKVFPAGSLGADFIKQVHGPLPHVKLLAVSGVSLADVPAYLAAGAAG